MCDFVQIWVRCNNCFLGLGDIGGMLTSCGHFACNRPTCRISCVAGEKTICPICKNTCGAVRLSDTLPNEVLQFLGNPEGLIKQAIDVMRFQDQQKELARRHFQEAQEKIESLEQKIDQLISENHKLKKSASARRDKPKQKITPPRHDLVIPGIIPRVTSTVPEIREPTEQPIQVEPEETEREPHRPISKLFTPTLASRLQNLTGKKVYDPVH